MKTITFRNAMELIDSGLAEEVGSEDWRWGTVRHYVFHKDGKDYMFGARFHVEEGIQNEGDFALTEVKAVEKTVIDWVRV